MILGCIGDDFTGSSDLGLMLAHGQAGAKSNGMKTVQYVGVPEQDAAPAVEAGIIALKTRSVPVNQAVEESLLAFQWLQRQGCTHYLFKYCSTFDSTHEGNIGPVIDALIGALDTTEPVIVCPAFPATGRTVYQGHLFVWDKLLSESGMQNHPVTPMTDSDVRRWLQQQTTKQVGHVSVENIRSGRVKECLYEQSAQGKQVVVCDAICDDDLVLIGQAAKNLSLITGGSGIAMALPDLLSTQKSSGQTKWSGQEGKCLAVSGSCSQATRDQISEHKRMGGASLKLQVEKVMQAEETESQTPEQVLEWASAQPGVPLVYSSDDPAQVKSAQDRFGAEQSAASIENFFGELVTLALECGFTRIISAGGETSGAVVKALNVKALEIGPKIDPGVPALRVQSRPLVLALKSGNFGATNFFMKADAILSGQVPDTEAT